MQVTATVALTDDAGNVVATETVSFEVTSPDSVIAKLVARITPGRH